MQGEEEEDDEEDDLRPPLLKEVTVYDEDADTMERVVIDVNQLVFGYREKDDDHDNVEDGNNG